MDLYRHYNAVGDLLYVGISLTTVGRLSQHRDGSGWYNDIDHVTIEKCKDRKEALDKEAQAIMYEFPKHNKIWAGARKELLPVLKHLANGRDAVTIKDTDLRDFLCHNPKADIDGLDETVIQGKGGRTYILNPAALNETYVASTLYKQHKGTLMPFGSLVRI